MILTALATPANPKNGAYAGHSGVVIFSCRVLGSCAVAGVQEQTSE